MFAKIRRHLFTGMPPALAIAAEHIAQHGGVAVIGRAVVFGERGLVGKGSYVFSHAVPADARPDLFFGHAGQSGDPEEGDRASAQVGTCEAAIATRYGFDVVWRVDANATALHRLRYALREGITGLSLEDNRARRVEWEALDPEDPDRMANRVSAVAPTGVALVDRPAFPGCRVAAVVGPESLYSFHPGIGEVVHRSGQIDHSDIMRLEDRATAAGRIEPVSWQLSTGRAAGASTWQMERLYPPPPTSLERPRGVQDYVNNRGENVQIGPVVPFGWVS
ncbi:hypothetical protein [Microbacterium sp. NPDC056234]|uniref:hypothetical protein n=1 Tax=Microbacterium sp. NPDC056234 TaxID=3345757 RepID=UPI0035DCF207